MPTARPRHTLTETAELAAALDAAADAWPELRGDRPALLRRLIEAGRQSVTETTTKQVVARRKAIRQAAGAATGAYPALARAGLSSEWPA